MKKGEFDLTGKAVDCSGLPALGDAGKEIFRALKVACNGVDDNRYGKFTDIGYYRLLTIMTDGRYQLCDGRPTELEPSDVLGQAAIDAAMDGATIVFEGDIVPEGVALFFNDGTRLNDCDTINCMGKGTQVVSYNFLEEAPSIESRILAEKVGSKHDQGKPRYDLIPPHAEAEFVDVLTFGATKYEPNQWKQVPEAKDRYTAAALRHLAAYRMGESHDIESGKHHLAHAMCCLSFIIELDLENDK